MGPMIELAERSGRFDRYVVTQDGTRLSWPGVASGLAEVQLRNALVEALVANRFTWFFFECCPWPADRDVEFEFVLVEAPAFAQMNASPRAFSEKLAGASAVATFDNLGRDARLVVPTAQGPHARYLHLAGFVRNAARSQVDATFEALGEAIGEWRTQQRGHLWVSTSGLGVPWIHLRLDSRPKYYTHAEYRRI